MRSVARLRRGEARVVGMRAGACLAFAWVLVGVAGAQRLPLRCWGVRDGLSHARVNAILQDARGYIWLGTEEGLSRFDGYVFRSFGVANGLGHPVVNDLVEDDAGGLWVATNGGGVARIDEGPTAPGADALSRFPVGPERADNLVNAMVWRGRELWTATDAGVSRSRWNGTALESSRSVLARGEGAFWLAALRDSRDRLWVGVADGLLEVEGETLRRHAFPASAAASTVESLAERPDGSILVATHGGAYVFRPRNASAAGWQRIPLELGSQQTLFDLEQGAAGELWIATRYGLIRWREGRQETFTAEHGLPDEHVRSLARDRDGNLWIGTNAGGVCRLAPQVIVSYTRAEGLPAPEVIRVVETLEGRVLALTTYSGAAEVREEGVRTLRDSQIPPWNTIGGRLFQDSSGTWWTGTGVWFEPVQGSIYRMPAGPMPELTRAERVSGRWQLPDDRLRETAGAIRQEEDGTLWFNVGDRGLYRRPAGADAFEASLLRPAVTAFLPEPDGDLWYSTSTELRLRRDGVTWVLPPPSAGLSSNATTMLRARNGSLWIGFRVLGLGRVHDAVDGAPRIERLTMVDGLLSDAIFALAEDRRGRIWIGTGRGVQILDPDNGRLRRMTTAHGLAGDRIHHLHLDRRGRMWVATATGLSRVDLSDEGSMPMPPPVYLTRVRAGGVERPVSPFGLQRLAGVRLVEPRNDLLVEFVGVSFAREGELRYQYRMVGAGDQWSEPAGERVVNFARLAPGGYRLEVRAVNEEGVVSERPAVLSLAVVPPVWQRGWFLALVAAALAATVLWLHRQRVARLLALERVRGQIAADLHDDVGAGLSEIAILSEAARGQETTVSDSTLARVAEHARSLRRALADTVWAVDPRRDRADELVRRMREVTHNLLDAGEVAVEFTAPPMERLERVLLAPDQRRDLLFLFQELIHNAARHAAAGRVEVELALTRGALRLTVRDDGRGFDPKTVDAGHGMANVRTRAARLGGRLEVDTAPGRGCAVELIAPLRP